MAVAQVEPRDGQEKKLRRRLWWWRTLKGITAALLLIVGALVMLFLVQRWRLQGRLAESLPVTRGEAKLAGLSAPVQIDRDALGVPTLRAANRLDLARALGYVHAQDRYFQMDLMLRRNGAGELAELLGPPVRARDRDRRMFRFRALARRVLGELPPDQRALIDAYTAGVNTGLTALSAPPFEYLVLAQEPEPWHPEDTLLTVLAMFGDLQSYTWEYETHLGLMHDLLPPALFEFLAPRGTEWDAPIQGEPLRPPPIPGPGLVDPSKFPRAARLGPSLHGEMGPKDERILRGSNSWAVDGQHTASGRALLANDIHLDLMVPNLWYRASFVWPGEDGSEHRVTGVTLPGIPVMVLGSNRYVAWGLTTSRIDISDIIVLDVDPKNPEVYRTPEGPKRFEHFFETIETNFGVDETLHVRWTVWGPEIGKDYKGRPLVLRWVAYDPGAVHLGSYRLETAKTLEEALEIANRSGVPAQNFLVADKTGRIAWTILGRLPRRIGFDGRLPGSWTNGTRRWDGLLPAEEVPRIIDPHSGRIWSANNRAVGGEMLAKLGDGGYISGARARQIRDGLLALPKATERDMLAIQLDDRALFLERWHGFMKSVLTEEAVAGNPRRRELRNLIQRWEGHAAVNSVSYRMVRSFRILMAQHVGGALTQACREADPAFAWEDFTQIEGPLWQLVTQRPQHLLDPRYRTWQDQFLAVADAVVDLFENRDDGIPLSRRTWGEANSTAIRHPLAQLMPLSDWLNMPSRPLPGDLGMPLVQRPNFGATLRMAVTPGREEQGYFHMPVGQSGHPRSEYYSNSHRAWENGEPTPFLPGPRVEVLTLRP